MRQSKGNLIVLTGPSGVGKGTLKMYLGRKYPWLQESISVTTRAMRPGEVDGVDYFFVDRERFQQLIETNELIEWAEYAGNGYGTPRHFVQEMLEKGQSVLLEIDTQGALQIKASYPEAILIFIEPPDLATLEVRLRGRKTNSDEEIKIRLKHAEAELALKSHFNHHIVNDNLLEAEQALDRFMACLTGADSLQEPIS